jgi:hypothetical protein
MTSFSHLPDPKDIYQTYLDVTSAAVLRGDYEAYKACKAVPFQRITEANELLTESEEEAQLVFQRMHKTFKAQNVTEYLRFAISANYLSETCICGRHETHIISRGTRVVPPYPNKTRLELFPEGWRATISSHAIQNPTHHMMLPRTSTEPSAPSLPAYAPERTIT